jgi:hypothetical protein
VTPPHQVDPAQCHHSSVRLGSTSPSSAGNPCNSSLRGCTHRCSPRRTPCTRFFCGCAPSLAVVLADVRPTALIAIASLAVVLADRCSTRRIPCTRFFGGCARRCLTRPSHCLHWLLMWLCSQILAPPHSLHLLLSRLCSQMLDPTHCLHWLLMRWCSQMLDPTHSLHLLLSRLCSQMLDPTHSLHWFLMRWCSQML